MRLERRSHVPPAAALLAPLSAVVAALLLAGGLIAAAGVSPLGAYAEIARGALGSRLALTETLARATPLIGALALTMIVALLLATHRVAR